MAKRKRRKHEVSHYKERSQRETVEFSKTDDLLDSLYDDRRRPERFRHDYYHEPTIQDRRVFRPITDNAFLNRDGSIAKIEVSTRTKSNLPTTIHSEKLAFVNPRQVTVCVRRKERRIALFASRKAGKGKSIKTPKKFDEDSNIRC